MCQTADVRHRDLEPSECCKRLEAVFKIPLTDPTMSRSREALHDLVDQHVPVPEGYRRTSHRLYASEDCGLLVGEVTDEQGAPASA